LQKRCALTRVNDLIAEQGKGGPLDLETNRETLQPSRNIFLTGGARRLVEVTRYKGVRIANPHIELV
jgi:hypothetical protein